MKSIIFILSVFITSFLTTQAFAQKVKTDTINVMGNCGMCKERIEEAAYVKGVKYAVWDKDTKKLAVSYNTGKTNLLAIQKNIINAGHDVGKQSADKNAYTQLPACCQYRTESCNH